jgi:hypothetical protein
VFFGRAHEESKTTEVMRTILAIGVSLVDQK